MKPIKAWAIAQDGITVSLYPTGQYDVYSSRKSAQRSLIHTSTLGVRVKVIRVEIREVTPKKRGAK